MTTLVIVIIWFSQVVLLEQLYTAGKRHEMIGSAGNIVSMVANADELPQDELKQLCAENNYCLEFYFPDYRSTIRFEPIGSGNLMRDELFERQSILIQLQSMDRAPSWKPDSKAVSAPNTTWWPPTIKASSAIMC